jgi:hypothetical protein
MSQQPRIFDTPFVQAATVSDRKEDTPCKPIKEIRVCHRSAERPVAKLEVTFGPREREDVDHLHQQPVVRMERGIAALSIIAEARL